MSQKQIWIYFGLFVVGFMLATVLFLGALLVEIGDIDAVLIQSYVIAITGLLGFGSVFVQNQLEFQNAERLRNRRTTENIDVVSGFLREAHLQFTQAHDILTQSLTAGEELAEIENRLNWLRSNVVENKMLSAPGYMKNSEFLRGLGDETIEVCLRYATFLKNFNSVLLFEQKDKEGQYRQLIHDALICAQLYSRAIELLEDQAD